MTDLAQSPPSLSAIPPSAPAPEVAAAATLSSLRTLAWLSIVLPLLLLGVIAIYRYSQVRTETDLRLDRALRIASEHALKVLDTNEVLLARVMDALGTDGDDVIRARESRLHLQLSQMLDNKPQIQSIWVLDAQGRPLATSRAYPTPPNIDVSNRPYFQWHRNGGSGLFVSEVVEGITSGQRVFIMTRGRFTDKGEFAGVVSISLLRGYFEKFHETLVADEPGMAITMLREDGAIYTRWPLLPDGPPKLAPNSPVMTRIKLGHTSGTTDGVSSVDLRSRLISFNKLAGYPIYMGTGMSVADMTQRWAKDMGWLAAFGIPPMLGLLLALRLALRRTRDALNSAARLNHETTALRRVEEALRQAQKLEALGRLTGGVAHDFNNALMVISNNLYLLRRTLPEGSEARLDSIARAVNSATTLTRQLLAFSRRQALVPEHFVLQDRLPGLRELLSPVLGSRIALDIDVAPGTQPIRIDPAEFELAILNLAINARDAMPAGGSFMVRARNAAETELPPLLSGPHVLVEASDTGSGIPPELVDKVFEPFFTTKPVGQGTGLGLAQVYGLCQRTGGTATVRSVVGHGCTIALYFAPDAGHELPAAAGEAPTRRALGLRVLLVEDNTEVAHALTPVLESLGCTVTHQERGEAARDWLLAQTHRPDVVLTDVMMPGEMDGVALANFIRGRWPDLGVVLMTGYTEQLDAIAKLGHEILPKPCSADTLGQTLARLAPRDKRNLSV